MQYLNIEQSHMRKVLFVTLALLVSSVYAKGEESVRSVGKNEIRLNLLTSTIGLPELNYERILGNHFGVGSAVIVGIKQEAIKAVLTPFGRYYFGEERGAGFFTELNTGMTFSSGRTNAGLGAAAGYKLISKRGWIAEAYAGVGKVFNHPEIKVYPRFGIAGGKRF